MIYLGRLQIACMEDIAQLAVEASDEAEATRYFSVLLGGVYEAMAGIVGVTLTPDMEPEARKRACQQVLDATSCPACGERGLAIRIDPVPLASIEEVARKMGGVVNTANQHAPALLVTHAIKILHGEDGIQAFRRPPAGKVRNN